MNGASPFHSSGSRNLSDTSLQSHDLTPEQRKALYFQGAMDLIKQELIKLVQLRLFKIPNVKLSLSLEGYFGPTSINREYLDSTNQDMLLTQFGASISKDDLIAVVPQLTPRNQVWLQIRAALPTIGVLVSINGVESSHLLDLIGKDHFQDFCEMCAENNLAYKSSQKFDQQEISPHPLAIIESAYSGTPDQQIQIAIKSRDLLKAASGDYIDKITFG